MTTGAERQGPVVLADAEAIAAALHRAAAEAARQAGALALLDAELGARATENVFRDGGALQGADLIRQEVAGLAGFLSALAQRLAADGICDPVAAAEGLDVRAQAARLSGLIAAPEPAAVAPDLWLD